MAPELEDARALAGAGPLDADTIAALREAARATTSKSDLSKLVDALLAHGEDVAGLVPADALGPWDAACVRWRAKGIGPRDVAERLGVEVTDAELADLEGAWEGGRAPFGFVTGLFDARGRVTGFDCETSVVPVDHAELVRELAKLAREVLAIDSVSQVWNRPDEETLGGSYTVRFVAAERAFAFEARFLGDWYDVPALVTALNGALEHAGKAERFVGLETGDQTCVVVLAREPDFSRGAAELCIPLAANLDAARRAGIAYEQHVRASRQL